jgi:hypothetical protein
MRREPDVPTSSGQQSVTFETTLTAMGNNTGIVVSDESMTALNGGTRPEVHVDLSGYQYQTTVGVRGGTYLISVSAAVRKATGLAGGDPIRVTLTLADAPRIVVVPTDLEEAFTAHPAARAFFEKLSNSVQRYHVDTINGARTAETRQRRVDRAVSLFLAGKPR